MITDADIKKMKAVFTTKDELKMEVGKLNKKVDLLDNRLDVTIQEVIKFIGETRDDIITLLSKQINDFRNEFNEFRNEMRDINRNSQSTLNNHESRIAHLEYTSKSS